LKLSPGLVLCLRLGQRPHQAGAHLIEKMRISLGSSLFFGLLFIVTDGAKLIVRVCDGPSCSGFAKPMEIATCLDDSANGVLDVSFMRCTGWCKRGINVKVVPEGAAEGIKIAGMTAIEDAAKCFHAINTPEEASRVALSVLEHMSKNSKRTIS